MTLEQIADDMECTCDEKSYDLCPSCEAARVLNEIGEIRRSALYEIEATIKKKIAESFEAGNDNNQL